MRRYRCVLLFWVLFALIACGGPAAPGASGATAPPSPPTSSRPTSDIMPPTLSSSASVLPYPYPYPHPTTPDPCDLTPTTAPTAEAISGARQTLSPIDQEATLRALGTLPPEITPSFTPPPGVTFTPTPTYAPTSTPLRGSRIITLADNWQTLYLAIGEIFNLKLGNQISAGEQIADQCIVGYITGAPVEAGSQGTYKALRAGETYLEITEIPPCGYPLHCEAPKLLFRLTIVVK
jgi:hypothetical protein